ncbi:hypothetical protein GLW03_10080 [Halobacillus halophilus]|uniref:hypothetical protein n=1 Tax=Halobacillus halophilus TaxID=1570 RepID=UPI00136AE121|nr:hypothetical protein [Halobacillus halophilus]MYL30167.1 hypothetical protein [Halobacillus halophilus]
MLTFEEKVAVIEEFTELDRKDISLGRVNFHYEDSLYDKKIVVYRLHPNGNGFVYAGEMEEADTDERGMINIKDYSADALRDLIRKAINSLSLSPAEKDPVMEEWLNDRDQALILLREEDGYNVYADDTLEGAFNSYQEAASFLEQEGFSRL